MDFIFRLAEEFLKKHKRLNRYRRVFAVIAAVVVFATTYELILPAITMDKRRAADTPGVEVGVAADSFEEEAAGNETGESVEEENAGEESGETPEVESADPADTDANSENGSDGSGNSADTDAASGHSTAGDADTDLETSEGHSEEESQEAGSSDDTNVKAEAADHADTADTGSSDRTDVSADKNGGTTETTDNGSTSEAADPADAAATTDPSLIAPGEPIVNYPATLVFEGKDYTITATFDEAAGLPADVRLDAVEILPDIVYEDENGNPLYSTYEDYYEKAVKAVEKEKKLEEQGQTVTTARFFDITFLDNAGLPVEPKAPVSIAVKYKDALSAVDTADTMAVHFDVDKKKSTIEEPAVKVTDVIDTKTDVKKEEIQEISFDAEKFSVYGVLGTELKTEITISNPDGADVTYLVSVTYGPEAKIPEGSWLRVEEINEGTDEYDYARNAVLADKKEKGESIIIEEFGFAALDISIINPEGDEIEPEAPVQVDLKIKSLPGVDDLNAIKNTLEIQHHVETKNGVIVDKVYDGDNEASFRQNTKEEIISQKEKDAVDPNSVQVEDFTNPVDVPEIDTSFVVDDFSTYSINWNYGNRKTTVHYGYMNGNTFVEFSEQPSPVNVSTDYRTYLIYDFEGYQYSGTTYYRTSASSTPASGGTRIQAQLRYSSYYNSWRYHTYSTSDSDNNWNSLANNSHIYVVYNQKPDAETGGTPQIDGATSSDWPQGSEAPLFAKTSVNNGDGTNTVSLSIKGGEKDFEKSTKANVIVVFDVSGSMSNNLNGQTRLARAKTAVNNMAKTLLDGDIKGVKMALISFSTTSSATPVQGFTDNYNTYRSAVNGLSADGGTNWEQALYNANRLEVDDDAATFVVFVTDGDPTYRLSRYEASDREIYRYDRDNNYFAHNIFGAGNDDPNNRAFDAAADEVKSILSHNKTFYAIGVSSDVTKVQNLVDVAGGGKAYLATDSDALEEAFASITQSIKTTLGFGDVKITDGITELSNVEMKVMQEVDPDSFTYYKITSSGQTQWDPASEGAGLAGYDSATGSVTWNMGDKFQLEDGVTYMVKFRVWPSQGAYDLVADLNNGIKVYASGQPNSITQEERDQVVELAAPTPTSQGNYTLKTNTDSVRATYSQTSVSGDTVTVSGETGLTATYEEGTIENMPLESMKLTIKKDFEDDLTAAEDRQSEVTLVLKRRTGHQGETSDEAFVNYPVPQGGTMSPNIVLNKGNNWTYEIYVAPGLQAEGEVLEHGYDYSIIEPDIDYHYDLIKEIVNPMVVDGEDKYYGDGYLIDDDDILHNYIDKSLSAINRVRSGIDIKKQVFDTDGTTEIFPETEFIITGKLLGPDGQPYTWEEGDSENASGAYHKYDKEGNRIIYKGHFADSSNISFTLKAGEYIRFINVPQGCTFEFTESTDGMDALGYEWKSTDAVTEHRTEPNGPFVTDGDVQPDVSGQTASLSTGVVGNKQYVITYGNKRTVALPDVELVKVDQDDNNQKLNDAEFTLYADADLTEPVTVDGNGNPIAIKTGNKEGSTGPDGWYHIGLLPGGRYYLVETTEPNGYVLDETPVIINIEKEQSSYSVSATKNGKNVLSGPTGGVYTITVENEINLTEVEAHKAWKNADGTTTAPQGSQVTYTLYADGEATDYTVELDGAADDTVPETAGGYESEGWTAKFINLPKYKRVNGDLTEIEYTIAETTAYPGYTASTTSPVADGVTITNTQVPTEVLALKAWKNADGTTTAPDGGQVTYTLYADGTATSYTVVLDGTADTAPTGTGGYESEAWTATFVNLPKYKAVSGEQVEIEYTIAETETYPGYTASTTNPVESGETITNTQGSTDTYAEKIWKNADGTDTAPEDATVVFTLYADSVQTDYAVTLNGTVDTEPAGTGGYESEAWKATFVNLPKQKIVDGVAVDIVYTIAETTGYPGYTASTTEPVGSGSKITNSQDSTAANALKIWVNADGTGTAPQGGQVIYTLYADGAATDYAVTLDGTVDTAPEVTGGYESTAWKAEFVNLPKYRIEGNRAVEIVYTIAETTTYPGYTASTTDPVGSGESITNTQEATVANALKAWKNADGSTNPPEGATVEFKLYADGEATEYKVTLDGTVDETAPTGTGGYENEAWKATFVNLPKYKAVEGEAVAIVYTIGESLGHPGYSAAPTDPVASGEIITNTQEEIDVNTTKAWLNADGSTTAPDGATVVFTLYANGNATDFTVTLDGTADETIPEVTGGYESEAWKASFVNLPKYQADGTTEIAYTIAETTGYESYEMNPQTAVESGGTITNKQIKTVIQIKKIGDWTKENTLSGVQFKLFSDAACENQIVKDSTGATIGTDGIITTASDGTVTIGSLTAGTYYLLEVATADGYNLLSDVVTFTIKADGTIEYATGNNDFDSTTHAFYELEDGGYGIYINNPSGARLPKTGGSGKLPYTLGGLVFVTATAMMYVFRMRRRERRVR